MDLIVVSFKAERLAESGDDALVRSEIGNATDRSILRLRLRMTGQAARDNVQARALIFSSSSRSTDRTSAPTCRARPGRRRYSRSASLISV